MFYIMNTNPVNLCLKVPVKKCFILALKQLIFKNPKLGTIGQNTVWGKIVCETTLNSWVGEFLSCVGYI